MALNSHNGTHTASWFAVTFQMMIQDQ